MYHALSQSFSNDQSINPKTNSPTTHSSINSSSKASTTQLPNRFHRIENNYKRNETNICEFSITKTKRNKITTFFLPKNSTNQLISTMAKENEKERPHNQNITETPISRETNEIRSSIKRKPSNSLNRKSNDTAHPQIENPYKKSIQTPRLTKRKRSYDILHSPLVSTNDDVVALTKIMTSSNTSKPTGYQDFNIVGTSIVDHNGDTQETVHRKAKVVSQVELKNS